MHFRIRKNVIQLIRVTYDKNKKKGCNTIIGTVALAQPELSDDLRMQMTSQEITDFEMWTCTHHRLEALRTEFAALTMVENMAAAEKWFEREGNSSTAKTVATEIVHQWHTMRKMFVKMGLLD
jgi:hypothetical protein